MSTSLWSDADFCKGVCIVNDFDQEARPELILLGPAPLKGSEVIGAIFGALVVMLIVGLCWGGVIALGFVIKAIV